jgi:uncharacterized repeat protein (TIGR01451 family)
MPTQTHHFHFRAAVLAAFVLSIAVPPLASVAQLGKPAARAGQPGSDGGPLNVATLADATQVAAGQEASFSILVWNSGPDDALLATVHDELPSGVAWSMPTILNADGDDSCSMASSIGPGGIEHRSFDCEFGTLPVSDRPEPPFGAQSPGKVIVVTGTTDRDDCGLLRNQAWAEASGSEPVGPAEASVMVRCSTLGIEVAADVEEVHFTFDADGDVVSVEPQQVTWTLTYTLGEGPVTNAVIADPLPEFLSFVSASHGGVHDPATGVLSWEMATLGGSGRVRVVTSVDPDAPETAPIVNVATIASDQTPEEAGRDEIRVIAGAQLGGNPPTRPPSVPDTARAAARNTVAPSAWVGLLLLLFGGTLGARAVIIARVGRRRR